MTVGRLLPEVLQAWRDQVKEMERRARVAMEMAFLPAGSRGKVIPFRIGDKALDD